MTQNRKQFLLHLIDDPDETVFQGVESEILQIGTDIVDELEQYLMITDSSLAQQRASHLIEDILLNKLFADCVDWLNRPSPSLIEGILLLNRLVVPDLELDELRNKLSPYYKATWLELNDQLTALEKTKILNHTLFKKKTIEISQAFPNRSKEFFMNYIWQNNRGNVAAVSLLYLQMSRELRLPIFGALIQNNLFLVYLDQANSQALFYISIPHYGQALGAQQLKTMLSEAQLSSTPSSIDILTDEMVVRQILQELCIAYDFEGNHRRLDQTRQLLKAWNLVGSQMG